MLLLLKGLTLMRKQFVQKWRMMCLNCMKGYYYPSLVILMKEQEVLNHILERCSLLTSLVSHHR